MSYFDRPDRWIKHARSKSSFYTYLERPAMAAGLPDLGGKSVLCLGVGSGEETELYEELGAASITGIDRVPGLIEAAKLRYPNHSFKVMDMNDLTLPKQRYDTVVSSMAMHYLESWSELLSRVHASLKPGGHFIFSTHNPVWWGAEKITLVDGYAWVVGVKMGTKDRSTTVLGHYLQPTKQKAEIFKNFPVEFYHRPFSLLVQDVIKSDFRLQDVIEPAPVAAAKQADPQFYRTVCSVSPIIVFKLVKTQGTPVTA